MLGPRCVVVGTRPRSRSLRRRVAFERDDVGVVHEPPSVMAVATAGLPKTSPQRPKGLLEVTITLARSLREGVRGGFRGMGPSCGRSPRRAGPAARPATQHFEEFVSFVEAALTGEVVDQPEAAWQGLAPLHG